MKYFLGIILALSFLISTRAFAEDYKTTEHIVHIEPSVASTVITITFIDNPFNIEQDREVIIYAGKSGSKYTDPIYSRKYSPYKNEKITLSGLPVFEYKTYYLYVEGRKDNETYPFTVSGNGYGLAVHQENGKTIIGYAAPKTDIRKFSLDIKRNGSTVLLQGLGDATKTTFPEWFNNLWPGVTATTSYFYTINIGDTTQLIAPGAYTASLVTVGDNGAQESVFGPISVSFAPTTPLKAGTDYQWPLTYVVDQKGGAVISGKVLNIATRPDKIFSITVEVSLDYNFSGTVLQAKASSVATDGSYSVSFSNLTPSALYYVRHTISSNATPPDVRRDRFNATDGYTPNTPDATQNDFNAKSYRLLSPFPKLTYVLDPDLCAQYKNEGKIVPNSICDINEFLNYILKLLIGFAGVALVLRIMFEGYKIFTTDVPYLKVNAKSDIAQACLGLALALTAWIILNTINPALVTNTIQLNDVAVSTEQTDIQNADYAYNGTHTAVSDTDKLKSILYHSNFPQQAWHDAALAAVQNSKLMTAHPSDAATFFPGGQVTAENWVRLLAGITYLESNYNPTATYTESFKDKNGVNVISTGLLQISQESARGYGFSNITTEQLKDPKTNLEVGVKILEYWIVTEGDNVITSGGASCGSNHTCRGGARYWSSLRI